MLLIIIIKINYRLWNQGTPKYLGESVTGVEIGIWKIHSSSCGWVRDIGQGHQQMCRQVDMTLLCMHKGFSHLNEGADDSDVI